MAMMRTQGAAATQVTGWLEDVQRDPRTVGAFRRRIEQLLRDPAVARRVAHRLDRRELNGCPTVAGGGAAASADRQRAAPIPMQARGRALVGAFLGSESGAVSIFGNCSCSTRCCLMVPHLRGTAGMGLVVPPPEVLRH